VFLEKIWGAVLAGFWIAQAGAAKRRRPKRPENIFVKKSLTAFGPANGKANVLVAAAKALKSPTRRNALMYSILRI
jgi:hypothetical protein